MLAIWPMVLLLIAIVAGTVVLFGIAFWRRPDAVEQISLAWVESAVMLRIISVAVIVPAIATLGVLGKISGGAAITAISAIAGYALGQASMTHQSRPKIPE
jgi:multisubunit Na+/H+ antiporter MnhG subunit